MVEECLALPGQVWDMRVCVLLLHFQANLRVGFWQNRVFAHFYFWAAGFYIADFVAGFLSSFLWESSGKNPSKILQNLHNRNPRHISAKGPGQANRTSRKVWEYTWKPQTFLHQTSATSLEMTYESERSHSCPPRPTAFTTRDLDIDDGDVTWNARA